VGDEYHLRRIVWDASYCSIATSTVLSCRPRPWTSAAPDPASGFVICARKRFSSATAMETTRTTAAYVAKWTGATIYASPETCDVMQLDVTRMFNDPNLHNAGQDIRTAIRSTVSGRAAKLNPGGVHRHTGQSYGGTTTVRRISQFDPQICIHTFKHVHSGTAPVDPSFPHTPLNNLGDPRYAGRVIDSPRRPSLPGDVPCRHVLESSSLRSRANGSAHHGFGGSAGIIGEFNRGAKGVTHSLSPRQLDRGLDDSGAPAEPRGAQIHCPGTGGLKDSRTCRQGTSPGGDGRRGTVDDASR